MIYLVDRPPCAFPAPRLTTVRHLAPITTPRLSSRRSTSDKMGQHTRARWRRLLVAKYGATCHICAGGIDLDVRWPDPKCFTRDHVKPRRDGGRDTIRNQRPAHKVCNESRGTKPCAR